MLKVGLTGGIGSGKTTVCNLFAEHGVPVIDADRIAHSITKQGKPGYQAICKKYGKRFLQEDGDINRPLLRSQVFSNDKLRKELENMLHPLIFDEIRNRVDKLHTEYCIISIPLLVETGKHEMLDRVLVIDAPDSLRIKRAAARDGVSVEEIESIMSSQAERDQRLAMGDDIIVNDGKLDYLAEQVEKLHNLYMDAASELR